MAFLQVSESVSSSYTVFPLSSIVVTIGVIGLLEVLVDVVEFVGVTVGVSVEGMGSVESMESVVEVADELVAGTESVVELDVVTGSVVAS